MSAANIAELVGDHLHTFFIMFIAALLGSSLAQLYFRVVITPPTAERLRRRLGRRLRKHFENVPPEKLDAALLATDRKTQTGWHLMKNGLGMALWFSVLVTGFLVFSDAVPDLPDWYGLLGIALLAFVCSYVVGYLSECSLRRQLEKTLRESGTA